MVLVGHVDLVGVHVDSVEEPVDLMADAAVGVVVDVDLVVVDSLVDAGLLAEGLRVHVGVGVRKNASVLKDVKDLLVVQEELLLFHFLSQLQSQFLLQLFPRFVLPQYMDVVVDFIKLF